MTPEDDMNIFHVTTMNGSTLRSTDCSVS